MTSIDALHIEVVSGDALNDKKFSESWNTFAGELEGFCSDLGWLRATSRGLKHVPYGLVAKRGDRWVGVLPLSFIRSIYFGKFLVSLPYVNTAGIVSTDNEATVALIERAIDLADELDVRYLELRHETPVSHPRLNQEPGSRNQ